MFSIIYPVFNNDYYVYYKIHINTEACINEYAIYTYIMYKYANRNQMAGNEKDKAICLLRSLDLLESQVQPFRPMTVCASGV